MGSTKHAVDRSYHSISPHDLWDIFVAYDLERVKQLEQLSEVYAELVMLKDIWDVMIIFFWIF